MSKKQTLCVFQNLEILYDGWPDISQIPLDLKPYAEIRIELSLCNDILQAGVL